MSNFSNLFAPIRVRDVYVKNRIESARLSHNGDVPFYTREACEMFGSFA